MNYCIYKMTFHTPLHCGRGNGAVVLTNTDMTIRADTLFSALCREADISAGESAVKELYELCRRGELLLSDTFPFCGERLYIPVPLYPLDEGAEFDIKNRKRIKAVKWLPADKDAWKGFSGYIHSGMMFDTSDIDTAFAVDRTDTKANVCSGENDTVPYALSCCEFLAGCGLYGIIAYNDRRDEEMILRLLRAVGLGGVGGQVSRGWGKYSLSVVSDENNCARFLREGFESGGGRYLLLTTSLPLPEETESALEDAYFDLVRRGGFSFSTHGETVKKQIQYFLSSGSVLKNRFAGDIFSVGNNGAHPIYRYSRPMFLGVEL